jgi:hypothetical protein
MKEDNEDPNIPEDDDDDLFDSDWDDDGDDETSIASTISAMKVINSAVNNQEIAKYFEKPLLDTWDIMTLLISRRWGKTYLNQGIATSDLLTPNSKIMLVAFSSSLAELWFQDILSNLLRIKELDGKVKWEKKKGYIYIPELNSSLQVSSYLNFDTLGIGRQFCKIYIDKGILVHIFQVV